MSNRVKVSIITPVYNTPKKYLRECIDSVLAQSFTDFEFLFCDDGSKPYIKKTIEKYNDDRIFYYRNDKNKGAAESRNKLIKIAKGEYLALLDADDIMHKDRLAKQVAYLDKHRNIGVLGTAFSINKKPSGIKTFDTCKELGEQLVFCGNVICNSSVMLRASVLERYNVLYKTKYVPAEDYALYLDLVELTEFAILPEVLCDYRSYSDNISHRQFKLQKYNAVMAQMECIEKYTGAVLLNKNIMADFAAWNIPKKPYELMKALDHARLQLRNKSQHEDGFWDMYKNCYRRICYKTYSLPKQFYLLFSPLRKYFEQSKRWQFFCFVTRGLLAFLRGKK